MPVLNEVFRENSDIVVRYQGTGKPRKSQTQMVHRKKNSNIGAEPLLPPKVGGKFLLLIPSTHFRYKIIR